MKILLINPNRYTEPPVPPLGLEYLAGEPLFKIEGFERSTNYQRLSN